ncbi:porin [Thioalkalivibrio sp. AKL6]|uniref:porin n=1 Tax=Thioalkalivibrio sp. AKL6 TaxID=1158154 RepID=UPI00035EEB3D|nr:porin [Thioalkalivibrio sp. AKL6]
MKKQILAVAVAGAFAVPAFAAADSDVTLFGQLQTQVVYNSGGSSDFDNGFSMYDAGGAGWVTDGNGPNRLGVMINHDLGNGLTALAKLEQDAQTTSGLNSGARDVYVGLDGNFGRVTMGRMGLPYNTAGKDPLNGTFMQARQAVRLGTADAGVGFTGETDNNGNPIRTGGIGGLGNGSYEDRVINYGNSFGMVGLQLAVAQNNGNGSGEQAISGRLNFDLGAVDLYVAHTNADDYRYDDADFQASKIGADWKSGPFRVVGEIESYKFEDALGNVERDATGGFVSGVYTMGRNDFVLTLGHTRNSSTDYQVNGEDLDGNTDFVALGVKHNFSNRVMAFAGVSYADHDDNIPFARAEGGAVNAAGNSYTGVGGGLRVSF